MKCNPIKWEGEPIAENGLYDIPEAKYHADPTEEGSLSYSGMKHLLKSSAHYKHYVDSERVEKKAFDEGHVVHALVLGQPLPLAIYPEKILASNGAASTTAAKEFTADAYASGLIPMKQKDFDPLKEIAEAVLADPQGRALFETDLPAELSMFARDKESGVLLRGRIDKLADDDGMPLLVDLKTCQDADPDIFRKDIARFGFYLQSAVYSHIWHLIHPDTPPPVMHLVAVSKTKPHLVSVHVMDWEYDDLGKSHMRTAIDRYKRGMETGEWPGYPAVVNEQAPFVWQLDDIEEELEV